MNTAVYRNVLEISEKKVLIHGMHADHKKKGDIMDKQGNLIARDG